MSNGINFAELNKNNTMKNLIGFLFTFLFVLGAIGQTININSVADVARQVKINEMLDTEDHFIPFSELARSPFLNEEFVKGDVFIKTTGKSFPALLRYHIFDDKFEIKKSPTETSFFELERDPQIDVVLNGQRFEIIENFPIAIRGSYSGYGMVMIKEDDDKASLYKRLSQTFVPAVPAEGVYKRGRKATLEDHTDYFVKINDVFYHIKGDRKEAPNGFPDRKNQLKDFISKNKLRFRDKTRDEDMMKLVNFYNVL